MEENKNGNTALLTVIGVATLLVALIGATFAYFSASVSNDNAQQVSVVTVNPIGLTYEGKSLVLENALPGDSTLDTDSNAKFYVENPSENVNYQSYDLTFVVDLNSFRMEHIATEDEADNVPEGTEQPNQLVASISALSTDEDNNPTLLVNSIDFTDGLNLQKDTTPTALVNDQAIAPGERHNYTIVLNFNKLETNQNENINKVFAGHIEISDARTIMAP